MISMRFLRRPIACSPALDVAGPFHPLRPEAVSQRRRVNPPRQSQCRPAVPAARRERAPPLGAVSRIGSRAPRISRTPISRSHRGSVPFRLPCRGYDCLGDRRAARRSGSGGTGTRRELIEERRATRSIGSLNSCRRPGGSAKLGAPKENFMAKAKRKNGDTGAPLGFEAKLWGRGGAGGC